MLITFQIQYPEEVDLLASIGRALSGGQPVQTAINAAPAPLPVVAAPAPAPAPVAAPAANPVFNEEDVANATRALATAKGIDTATGLLKEFEIEKARDLPADKREAYIGRAKQLQAAQ